VAILKPTGGHRNAQADLTNSVRLKSSHNTTRGSCITFPPVAALASRSNLLDNGPKLTHAVFDELGVTFFVLRLNIGSCMRLVRGGGGAIQLGWYFVANMPLSSP